MYPTETDIKRTVSYASKIKGKFKRQKRLMEMYNSYWYSYNDEKDRLERLKINYDLANGIVDDDIYNSPLELQVEGQDVELGYAYVAHHPLVAGVVEAAVGEEILMPFKIVIEDVSRMNESAKKDEKKRLLTEYLKYKFIEPNRQKVLSSLAESGVDLGQLPPEEAQKVAAQIEEQVKVLTPDKIEEYIENDYKSVAEIQGQKLMNHLTKSLHLKKKKNEAFEDAFIIAEEYYLVGINHDEPTFDVLNPKNVEWAPSPGNPWIQDALYALNREEVTIQEAFALDGEYLENADVKRLSELVHGYGYNHRAEDPRGNITIADEAVIMAVEGNPDLGKKYAPINLQSQEGQNKMMALYDEVLQGGLHSHGDMYLTRTYIAWRDMAYFNRVKSQNLETGKIDYRWESEDYTLNPERGDLSMKRVEKPEVWHGVVYGYGDDAVYIKIEPVPNQRKSLENIHEVQLPFFGGKIGTKKGNSSKNMSNVDRGKQWNYKFDLQMAEIELKQSVNMGKVFVMIKELKPQEMDWGEWVNTMKYLKILMLDGTREDGNFDPSWVQMLKGVDISTLNDIGAAINLLQYFQTKLAESMHFSQERLGKIGQYMTASTSKDAINASEVQTTKLYDTHNYIFTLAIQYLLDVARTAYKNNPPKRGRVLGYISEADLELDWEMLSRAELGVFASISPADVLKIRAIKERTQEMIQNQMLDIEDLFKFEMTETPAELMNLGAVITKKRQTASQQAQEAENARIEQAVNAKFGEMQKAHEYELQLKQMDGEIKREVTMIDSMKFANAADVDQNQQNDFKEINDDKMELEREKLAAKTTTDNRKIDTDSQSKSVELQIKEKELAIKARELSIKEKELDIKILELGLKQKSENTKK